MQHQQKSGFTLVELMIVLVIAAIISSITFGAFRSISEGNKRSNCSTNLSQLYQASRLYAQDYNGKFPYLNPKINATTYAARTGTQTPDQTPPGGIGLWALYTYPKPFDGNLNDRNCDYPRNTVDLPLPESEMGAPALAGYIKNARIFHCPADTFKRNIEYRADPTNSTSACTPALVNSGSLIFTPNPPLRRLNPAYLSYQTTDDVRDVTSAPNPAMPENTYSSFRMTGASRQLTYFVDNGTQTSTPERPADDRTVVTWCRFHRAINENNGDNLTQINRRSYDNVLFNDGTVQNIPTRQDIEDTTVCTAAGLPTPCTFSGWQRTPKRAQ